MIFGVLLRIQGLISRPLWLDEALQADISRAGTLAEVLSRSAELDLHPPGFALCAWLSTQLLGPAEWALRMPSLIAGGLTIPLAWAAGRAWGGREVAATFALAAAVCPPWVAYAREARPYAGAIAWVIALIWAAGVHRKSPSILTTTALVICAAGALCWQYTAGVIAVGILGGLAITRRGDRGAILAIIASLSVGLGLFYAILRHQLADRADVAGHLDLSLLTGPFELIGYCAMGSWRWNAIVGLVLLPLVLRRIPRDVAWIALLPVGLLYALALVGLHPFGGIRQCLVLTPALLLAGAHHRFGLERFLPLGLIGAVVVQIARFPGVPVWNVPALAAQLEPEIAGHPVWVDPRLGRSWAHYGQGIPAQIATWSSSDIPSEPTLWIITVDGSAMPDDGRPAKQLTAEGVTATLWIVD